MGFFSDFKNDRIYDGIKRNGLPKGTHSECCERCCYRMDDPKSNFLVCAQHKIHVGAEQTCQLFSRGSPLYRLS